jgi:UDP-glucose 4-epimerase
MSDARTALVAGVNGFVGAALARCLTAAGWRVFGLGRVGSSYQRLDEIAGLQLLEVDSYAVDELRRVVASVPSDVVFNLAAAGVKPSAEDPLEMFHGNALLAANLVQAVAARGVRRFIHVGSCAEYAAGQTGKLMNEWWPQEPASPYGVAKLTATHLARVQALRSNVPLTVVRLFGVYGPGEAPHRLLPAILRGLTNGQGVDLTPGLQQRDWLYIDDAAEALVQAAAVDHLGPSGTIYNICTGQAASVREVGEQARALLGAPANRLHWGALPYRPDEPMWVLGDGARFRERTGWQPRWSWRDGVRAMVLKSVTANRAA